MNHQITILSCSPSDVEETAITVPVGARTMAVEPYKVRVGGEWEGTPTDLRVMSGNSCATYKHPLYTSRLLVSRLAAPMLSHTVANRPETLCRSHCTIKSSGSSLGPDVKEGKTSIALFRTPRRADSLTTVHLQRFLMPLDEKRSSWNFFPSRSTNKKPDVHFLKLGKGRFTSRECVRCSLSYVEGNFADFSVSKASFVRGVHLASNSYSNCPLPGCPRTSQTVQTPVTCRLSRTGAGPLETHNAHVRLENNASRCSCTKTVCSCSTRFASCHFPASLLGTLNIFRPAIQQPSTM
ncbi:hypothetical protein J6590_028866, partial [Homalodisca vitripennis]